MIRARGLAAFAFAMAVAALPAGAQDPPHVHDATPAAAPDASWQWSIEGRVFFGYNIQDRKFTDFDVWESQNWLMTSAARTFGASRIRFVGMFSAEPATLEDIGSPQVFQTGETYQRAPLIDYQHPHDLFMNLGADFSHKTGETAILGGAYLVGPAPLGPPPFMHRPSAAENPQSPLAHHMLDSTHITAGVLSAGLERAGVRVEGGWFQGREPDEDRTDLDLGALDSWSTRLSYARGAWSGQVSGGRLKTPEATSPYDMTRLTASVSYVKGNADRLVAWMAAFGQNREFFGHFEAYLLEGTLRQSRRNVFYTRAESVAKDILDAGFHPIGFAHKHRQSRVGALTLGYVRDIFGGGKPSGLPGSIGIGADITGYYVPANLKESYGSPLSYHVFVRYRGSAGAPSHVH
jgi:hypothetical protein